MSVNVPTFYSQQFSTNVALLVQQEGSVLEGAVLSGTHVGKQASPVDQVGSIVAQKVTTRFGAMPRIDAPTDRRWVFPVDYDLPQLLDTFDQVKMVVDPRSSYVTNAGYAMGRAKDAEIAGAFFGTSKTGETGGTSTTFPAGQKVAITFGSSGNSGLSTKKLKEARRILLKNRVNLKRERLICVLTAKQHDELLDEVQVTSTDFNPQRDGMPVLTDGFINRFLGIDFILYEDLPVDASSDRQVPVFVQSALYLGRWIEIKTNISVRNDLQGEPWQVYCMASFGATRLEEKKIVQITCDE